jgi:hypothetical protein
MQHLPRSAAPIVAACAVILVAITGAPLDAAPAASATPASDTEIGIRAHMAFLADDLLEGRVAGSRGYDLAARYVAAQFEAVGLEPGGDNGTWLQSVPLIEGQRVPLAARLSVSTPTGVVEATPLDDFIAGVDFVSQDSEVSAPAVFVGFGVTAPEQRYDDFANGIDIRGKIAVVLSGAPPAFPSSVRAHHGSTIVKTANLAQRGAVGVITVSTPVDETRTPWPRAVQQSWVSGMRWLNARGEPENAWPGIKVSMAAKSSFAAKLLAGAERDLAAAFKLAETSIPQAFPLPATVTMSRKTALRKLTSANVVGLLRGTDQRLKNEYVVFTAHLDHIGKGAAVNGDSIYNGAMDNAAGVAALIEAAKLLKRERRLKRSILFIALTAEEKGLLGADYFVANPTVPRDAIAANVNMDMPVAPFELAEFVAFGAEHSSLGAVAERAARAEGSRLVPDPTPAESIFVRSDQYAFVRAGIPALYIDNADRAVDSSVDGPGLVRQFMRERYHQPSDDLAQPIHYPTLARLARINVRMGRDIANARGRPLWNRDNFFGRQYGPERMQR